MDFQHQYKISRISAHWEASCSVPTDWPTHTMNLRWLFAFLLRTRLKIAELITGCVFVPALKKTAGDGTVRSLFTLFCCFYATFVFTAQAWMACVVIMLTSRWNESATVHSLRVKVLHLTVAEYASWWYWVSQFLCNEEIYLRMQIL